MKTRLPVILFALYLLEFVLLTVRPTSRTTWISENLTVACIVTPLVWMYLKGIRFSNTAYLFMSVLIFLHTLGGHYTFAQVPFGWITNLIGAQRNHFDRLAHFSVGFFAFGLLEFIESRRLSHHRAFSLLFAISAILAVAALFEIFEWLYATAADPVAAMQAFVPPAAARNSSARKATSGMRKKTCWPTASVPSSPPPPTSQHTAIASPLCRAPEGYCFIKIDPFFRDHMRHRRDIFL